MKVGSTIFVRSIPMRTCDSKCVITLPCLSSDSTANMSSRGRHSKTKFSNMWPWMCLFLPSSVSEKTQSVSNGKQRFHNRMKQETHGLLRLGCRIILKKRETNVRALAAKSWTFSHNYPRLCFPGLILTVKVVVL